mmetsp:Transcript_3371/g.15067  ORF Transcript_3371/g.15067 Transcript_3371/m.15067 type:complete len:278 (-) Transcript_3371:708-1541(-)
MSVTTYELVGGRGEKHRLFHRRPVQLVRRRLVQTRPRAPPPVQPPVQPLVLVAPERRRRRGSRAIGSGDGEPFVRRFVRYRTSALQTSFVVPVSRISGRFLLVSRFLLRRVTLFFLQERRRALPLLAHDRVHEPRKRRLDIRRDAVGVARQQPRAKVVRLVEIRRKPTPSPPLREVFPRAEPLSRVPRRHAQHQLPRVCIVHLRELRRRIVLAPAKREELGQVEERRAVQEELAEDAAQGEDVRRLRDASFQDGGSVRVRVVRVRTYVAQTHPLAKP